jgi:lysozyme family protein
MFKSIADFFTRLFSKPQPAPKPVPVAVPPIVPAPVVPPPQLVSHAVIEKSLPYVLTNEGGFSDEENDAGGATNYGITHDDLAQFLGHSVSTSDVKNMTLATATEIYKKLYWDVLDLDQIIDQNVATCIFDMGVNFGNSIAVKFSQQVCNVTVDGHLGPITIAAINKQSRENFIRSFENLCEHRYNNIVASRPSQMVFYRGWMARAKRLLTLI